MRGPISYQDLYWKLIAHAERVWAEEGESGNEVWEVRLDGIKVDLSEEASLNNSINRAMEAV